MMSVAESRVLFHYNIYIYIYIYISAWCACAVLRHVCVLMYYPLTRARVDVLTSSMGVLLPVHVCADVLVQPYNGILYPARVCLAPSKDNNFL